MSSEPGLMGWEVRKKGNKHKQMYPGISWRERAGKLPQQRKYLKDNGWEVETPFGLWLRSVAAIRTAELRNTPRQKMAFSQKSGNPGERPHGRSENPAGFQRTKEKKKPLLISAAHVSTSPQSSGKFIKAPDDGLHNTRQRCLELSVYLALRFQVWISWWPGTGEFACSPVVWVGSVLAVGVAVCLLFMLSYDELASPCTPPLAPRWVG